MNKYVVNLKDGKPICTVIKSDQSKYTMEGLELIQFLGRIDEKIYGRKTRRNPLYYRKDKGPSLIYINPLQRRNIQIRNYNELIEPLKKLYLENRESVRKDIDKRKKVLIGTAATSVMIGGLALAAISQTANKNVDLEKTARYEEELVKDLNTTELVKNKITPEIEIKSIVTDDELTNEEVESLSNNLVKLNVDPVYDEGIINNMHQYADIIHIKGSKRGVGDKLLHDVISQESAGANKNLSQFEFRLWEDQVITSYNFEKQKYEKIVFTNKPEEYRGKVDITITEKELANPYTSIAAGAIVLQQYGNIFNHNILLTLYAYNVGPSRTVKTLETTAERLHCSVQDIINDPTNTDWLDDAIHDEHGLVYPEEVGKHVEEHQMLDGINDIYTLKYIDENGEEQVSEIQVQAVGRKR